MMLGAGMSEHSGAVVRGHGGPSDRNDKISRRDAMRRVALVGGAAVWAAPAVQRLGMVAAHAVSPPPSPPPTSPPPPPPPPPPTPTPTPTPGKIAISYVGLVFTCDGQLYRAKWEGSWVDVSSLGQFDSLPGCPAPSGWTSAAAYANPGGTIQVSPTYDDGELLQVSFTLPEGCAFADGSGVAKGGNPESTGYCVAGSTSNGGRTITFVAPS